MTPYSPSADHNQPFSICACKLGAAAMAAAAFLNSNWPQAIPVTHNMQQAARASDYTAFFTMDEDRSGILVEYDKTEKLYTNPSDSKTEAYISGRFG